MRKANKYYDNLDFFSLNNSKDDKHLKITRNNADFIEAVLKIDSRYSDSGNKNKKPSIEYINYIAKKDDNINKYDKTIHEYGSAAYWLSKLAKIINKKDVTYSIDDTFYKEKGKKNEKKEEESMNIDLMLALKGCVCAIDRENSTHLTAKR